MENYNKALHTLEYYKILDMLCDCAPTLGAGGIAPSDGRSRSDSKNAYADK